MDGDTQIILFGADDTPGIVAVEAGDDTATLFIRRGGEVEEIREAFRPWLLAAGIEGVDPSVYVTLEGEGYRYRLDFPNWGTFLSSRSALRSKGIDCFSYGIPEKQLLVSTGRTLFKGLSFDDVHRMQLDIETSGLSWQSDSSRVLFIAVSDNRGMEEILEGTEKEMLLALVRLVHETDPDVIEGHNIYGFDFPFLCARARRWGVSLALGRDYSEVSLADERTVPIGGYARPFVPVRIHGRHVVDTLIAVQRYDLATGRLERHGLKESALALGVAEPDRVYIPGDEIAAMWETEPENVKLYARQDVRETRGLSCLVCASEFYLTQMAPDTYQSVVTTGTGEKINALLVREYLRRGHAVSFEQPGRSVVGGYTELRRAGVIPNVVKCDVESLYPSLMLSLGIKPASDTLDIFLPALAELTRRRIDAKTLARTGPVDRRIYWDGLQGSFKILINSFYGYLGAPFNFNDFDAAEKITTTGQAIVKGIASNIEDGGGKVIEIDTDGVYFQPPPEVSTYEEEVAFVESAAAGLPEGVRLAHDGRYAAMISLKIKNYILVGYDGKKTFKGSALRSRSDEPFGRLFISEAADLLVKGDRDGAVALYNELADRIRQGELPVEMFSRRERVTSKTFSSAQKKRMAVVAKGVAIGDYINVYEKSSGELGLAEHYAGDENRAHLLDKLHKFASRLREAFGDDFDEFFPPLSRRATSAQTAEAAGQQTLDLF